MREITLSLDGVSVRLTSDADFKFRDEEESKEGEMASKKIVKDVVGNRKVLDIPAGYVPLPDLKKLRAMLLTGKPLSISFPGVGADDADLFFCSKPDYHTAKYGPDGVSIWKGISLTLRSVEVTKPPATVQEALAQIGGN